MTTGFRALIIGATLLGVLPWSGNTTIAQPRTLELDELLAQSSELLLKDQSAAALGLLKQHEEAYSSSPEFMNNLAIAYLSEDQPKFAFTILRQLINQDPTCNVISHNMLELELEIAGAGSDKITPALFLQAVDKQNSTEQTNENLISQQPVIQTNSLSAASPSRPSGSQVPAQNSDPGDKTKNEEPRNQVAQTTGLEQSGAIDTSNRPPVSAPTSASDSIQVDADIIKKSLHNWAKSWSEKNFDQYISYYSSDFVSAGGANYPAWEKYRRGKLAEPGDINIKIDNIRVRQLENQRISAIFAQQYSSATLIDKVEKEIIFEKTSSDVWKFISETVTSTY